MTNAPEEAKIVSATIVGETFWAFLGSAEPKIVTGTFEDGSTQRLFSYYSDELSFTTEELVGLTAQEAKQLWFERDVEWLRTP
jgi:hypothetical protein